MLSNGKRSGRFKSGELDSVGLFDLGHARFARNVGDVRILRRPEVFSKSYFESGVDARSDHGRLKTEQPAHLAV
jgi:hypothetical protein